MFCRNCGKPIDDEAMFCPACGSPTTEGNDKKEKNNDEKQNASKSGENNATNENKSKDELASKMQSIKNNPDYDIDNHQVENNSKTSIGVVLGLFLGFIGLIIGLLLYNNENESRQTFIKGWVIGFVVCIVLAFIFVSIYLNKIDSTINDLYDYGNIYY